MGLFLTEPKDVENFFNVFLPEIKVRTLVSAVGIHIDNAEFLANLYRTPTFDLETLKLKVDDEWKKRPLLQKVLDNVIGPWCDRPKEIRNEINFRGKNTRGSEEWKQPFINLADRYAGKEFEEVRDYILNTALPGYQQTHFS